MTDVVQLHCCLCGQGSTRPFDTWNFRSIIRDTQSGNAVNVVACDHHSEQEFKAKLKELAPAPPPTAKTVDSNKTPAPIPSATAKSVANAVPNGPAKVA